MCVCVCVCVWLAVHNLSTFPLDFYMCKSITIHVSQLVISLCALLRSVAIGLSLSLSLSRAHIFSLSIAVLWARFFFSLSLSPLHISGRVKTQEAADTFSREVSGSRWGSPFLSRHAGARYFPSYMCAHFSRRYSWRRPHLPPLQIQHRAPRQKFNYRDRSAGILAEIPHYRHTFSLELQLHSITDTDFGLETNVPKSLQIKHVACSVLFQVGFWKAFLDRTLRT